MKTVALIVCDDNLYSGGMKTINSLKYFHPEIEIVKIGTKEIDEYRLKYNHRWLGAFAPNIILDVWEKESPDLLIKIGADCLVLDNLSELIDGDYDVASARNDPDQVNDDRDESMHRPDVIKNIKNSEWVNADLICIKNKNFLKDYCKLMDAYRSGLIKPLADRDWYDDQYALNVVFKLGGYNTKILDPKGSNVIYGASGNWNHGKTNWDSWKDIYYNDEAFIMTDGGRGTGTRYVKMLHCCGGTNPDKLNFNLFNENTKKYIQNITKFNE